MKGDLTYKVKCRGCNKITEMYLSNIEVTSIEFFRDWFIGHSAYPIERECECDPKSFLLHDLISKIKYPKS